MFNCEWREKEWWKNALFEQMDYKDYIAKFDLLWLLSKESMLNNGLEEYAGKVTKRVPRLPVDKELLQNLLQYRLKISKEIQKSGTYSEEETDELIQKLLSRLLFIRNCEDRGFEAKYKLQPLIELYKLHKRGLMKALAGIFKHYDDTYNSGLFEEREIDKIKFDEKLLAEVIESLYFMSDGTRYNFNVIPADIMGNLYEQYLGHILKKTPERTKLKDGKAHRKEQGIYYTPAYIVDYIVKNTVGELLKDKKVKADKIRILDPACGSGSFLIKAFQAMDEYYKSKDKKYDQTKLDSTGSMYSKKVEILQNNIFGVDLDKQAIELARLNLLLQIAEKGEKLPSIEKKIQCGNSLIDDPAVAGEDKAFKWEDRFKDVMDEGGFDVVIGNPPYGLVFKEDEKHFIETNLPTFQRNNDLYVAFIEKAIMLLKEEGLFSFIIPNTYLIGSYFDNLKKFILEKARIIKIVDFGINQVFEDPNVFNSIIILQKIGSNIKREKNIFKFIDVPFIKNTNSLDIDNISVVTDIPQIQLKDMAWKPKNNIIDKLNRQKEKDVIDVCHVKDVGFNYWSEGRGKKRGNSIGSRVLYDGERKIQKIYLI